MFKANKGVRKKKLLYLSITISCVLVFSILNYFEKNISLSPAESEPLTYKDEDKRYFQPDLTVSTQDETIHDVRESDFTFLEDNETNIESSSTNDTDFHGLQQFLQDKISDLVKLVINQGPVDNAFTVLNEHRIYMDQILAKNFGNADFSNYTMEKGGKPIRNIILTTWRSGSTFLGEALSQHPAMFYHYEPLLHFGIVQVRSGTLAEEGLRVINSLLECDYSNLKDYIDYGETHPYLHTHNFRLWNYCKVYPKLCLDSEFLSQMCQTFPFQVMKTVRLRLGLAETLLNDDKLDLRILLLVRDPRGTMLSRNQRDWCPENPDCFDPSHLCSDMIDDFNSAKKFYNKFREKFMVIRYEDLSLNPYSGVKKVLQFFRLQYHPFVDEFIRTHTEFNEGGVSSTFRDSKSTPFKWIDYFSRENNTEELNEIQGTCTGALRMWGYAELNVNLNNTHFTPVLQPPWLEMAIPLD